MRKFLSLFPDFLTSLQNEVANKNQSRTICLNNQFIEMLDRLLESLHREILTSIKNMIKLQLENIKILPYTLPETTVLELPQDQYYTLSTISSYMGRNDNTK